MNLVELENALLRYWLRRDARFDEVESWVMGIAELHRPSGESFRLTHAVIGDLLERGLLSELAGPGGEPLYRASPLAERLRAARLAELCRAAGVDGPAAEAVVANVVELGTLPLAGVLNGYRHALGGPGAERAADQTVRRLLRSGLFVRRHGELRLSPAGERLAELVEPPARS